MNAVLPQQSAVRSRNFSANRQYGRVQKTPLMQFNMKGLLKGIIRKRHDIVTSRLAKVILDTYLVEHFQELRMFGNAYKVHCAIFFEAVLFSLMIPAPVLLEDRLLVNLHQRPRIAAQATESAEFLIAAYPADRGIRRH